ncbi:MAG: thioesterase superfamily [Acidobacteriales bacterium]|nr:thioesterase superfamily [Terriglobales bacterium]
MPKKTHASGHDTHKITMPKNTCFGCGNDNPEGMKLKFHFEGNQAVCDFQLSKKYQGPPGHAHGGIIATILDEAMGKVNKLRSVIALTKTMDIEYLRPVPLGKRLKAVGHESTVRGRKHYNAAEIRNEAGEVLARSKGIFIAVDASKMFAKYVNGNQKAASRR